MNANPHTEDPGKILIIDDEAGILITLKRILRTAGYEARTAGSGREGLGLFQQAAADVVIVDRSMPEMNGEEVAAEIKRLAPNVPIILITGFPGAVIRRELFHAVIGKPFRPPELLQCLSDCLHRGEDERGAAPDTLHEKSDPVRPGGEGFPVRDNAAEALPAWKILLEKPCVGSA